MPMIKMLEIRAVHRTAVSNGFAKVFDILMLHHPLHGILLGFGRLVQDCRWSLTSDLSFRYSVMA